MVLWSVRRMAARRGITTAIALAERVGVNINTANGLMTGRSTRVDLDTLSKLCDALDCQIADLLEYQPGDDQKNTAPRLTAVAV